MNTVKLRPITRMLITIGELPTSYLVSMTYEEQILWLCNYIETKVIPAINTNADAVAELEKALDELKVYVDEYFDNLDIEAEIDRKIDELLQSGELIELILDYLQMGAVLGYKTLADLKASEHLLEGSICRTLGLNDYFDGEGAFYLIRAKESSDMIDEENIISLDISADLVGEKIKNNFLTKSDNIQMNELPLKRIIRKFERNSNHPDHVSGEDYALLQGGAYIENDKMIICNIRNNSINDTRIQEINLKTGSVIREAKLPLSHANSVTYNPNNRKLYITSLILNNTPLQYLYVVNYDTLTLDETVSLDVPSYEGVHSVSYDIITDKYYVATEDTNQNNKLTLYSLNISDYSTSRINLNDATGLLATTNNNDILVYNNILYILKFHPSILLTYDLSNNKLVNIYNIEDITKKGQFVGELENISIKYDTDLKNLVILSNMIECTQGFYHKMQVFETNTVHGINEDIYSELYSNIKNVYVDINSTAINPDGSYNNKFKHISEALEIANICDNGLHINIADGEYPFTFINNANSNITIVGNTNDYSKVIVSGINITGTNSLYLTALKIDNKNIKQNYDIAIWRSNVKISNIIMNSNINCHIHLRGSILNTQNIIHTNYFAYCQTESTINGNEANLKYKVLNQIPIFNKPILISPLITISTTPVEINYSGYELMVENINAILTLLGSSNYVSYENNFYSRNNAGNRFITIVSNDIITTIRIDYDITNKKLSAYILKAIRLTETGTVDITNTHTLTGALYYNRII